jgi:Spermine/spermidine synthase domain
LRRPLNIIFQVLSFIAAFLLFYLELLLSKSLLPVLGGAYFVWVGCVSFFTLVMLLSNWAFKVFFEKLEDKITYLIFFILGFAALFSFPIKIPQETQGADIVFIFLTLAKNIGLPFFILSATSPVIQKFFYNLYPEKNPYTLYGISNLGSFLALIFFPLFFEPFFPTSQKYFIVYGLYGLFIALFASILFPNLNKVSTGAKKENGPLKLSWIFLSSSTTAFFLATTNYITYDIGSAPLFWAIPLGLFLLSFILNFKVNPWNPKYLIPISLPIVFILEFFVKNYFAQVFAQYLLLFVACCEINKLLYESRPKEEFLPSFYFSLSLGGMIGSFGILLAGPTLFKHNKLLYADFLLVFLLIVIGLWFHLEKFKNKRLLAGAICLMLIIFYFFGFLKEKDEYFLRNFYGIYTIKVKEGFKTLYNGAIIHGSQDLANPTKPLAYYAPDSPVGKIFKSMEFKNIASVGLGVGNLLAYGKTNQTWDIIEIDPDVIDIAKNNFSYIKNCPAKINFLIGDGRLILNKQPNVKYDLIIIDAFTGDNIPFHLLSLEAIKIYLDKLKDEGLIALHISNRYHDFLPLLQSTASHLKVNYFWRHGLNKNHENGVRNSNWFFMEKVEIPKEMIKLKPVPWTDSYYNFWDTLKLFK